MIKQFILCLTLATSLSGIAFGQGSGSAPFPGRSEPDPGRSESAFRVSKTVTAKALAGTTAAQLVLEQRDGNLTLSVPERTKIKAERGAEIANPGKPGKSDLKAGLSLRVRYHPDKNEVSEILILKGKS